MRVPQLNRWRGGFARAASCAGLLALAACQPQATSGYLGEPLVTLQGQVVSNGALPPLEAAMLWQRGDPPRPTILELATLAPVQSGFPATFTLHLYQPPPAAARRSLIDGGVVYARANASAVPYGIAVTQISDLPASGNPSYGIDALHWVIYLDTDVPAGSLTEWWLGAPLGAGFHLVDVIPFDPSCETSAQLDACAADLVTRGVIDDGTDNPGTARFFCVATYRLDARASRRRAGAQPRRSRPRRRHQRSLQLTGAETEPLARAQIERLYRSHGHLVLRRARLLLGSEPDAQEALQEVFAIAPGCHAIPIRCAKAYLGGGFSLSSDHAPLPEPAPQPAHQRAPARVEILAAPRVLHGLGGRECRERCSKCAVCSRGCRLTPRRRLSIPTSTA